MSIATRLRGPVLGSACLVIAVCCATPVGADAQARVFTPTFAATLWGETPDTLAPASTPTRESLADPRPAPPRQEWRDAWGQPRNFGLAAAEAYLSNFLPWMFNELVSSRAQLKISQLSPRSWKRNLDEGWQWDDNSFQVNHFAHPFQGNMYFNAARSNGFGYWTSLLFATAGSFHWECCGETHLMSVNDWANTSLGGAAVGEMLYRTSSMVLDNQATGAERFWREAAAFALVPNRGFTRLVTGNARKVYANPEHPSDRVPERFVSVFSAGMRFPDNLREARGGSLDEGYPDHGFINIQVVSGDMAELDRQRPFDFFTLDTQFNFVNGRGLGELRIQGNLWHTDLARTERTASKFVVLQDFEYENTGAFEQGGQGVSFMYLRNRKLGDRHAFTWNAAATATILGGVKSELSFLAEVEGIRERFREYDFGWGPGLRSGFAWAVDGERRLSGSYRAQYLTTLNGSRVEGQGSDHVLQTARVRGLLPLPVSGWALGASYEYFHRRSQFDIAEIGEVRQRVHQWQLFMSWRGSRADG